MKGEWIAGKKTKNTGIKCSSMDIQKASCKAGMLKWKHSETVQKYRQPRQLREQTHSSKLKTRQIKGCAMPIKQHPEFHLVVKVVREREQEQGIAGGNPAGRTANIPINFVVVSSGWLVGELVVG